MNNSRFSATIYWISLAAMLLCLAAASVFGQTVAPCCPGGVCTIGRNRPTFAPSVNPNSFRLPTSGFRPSHPHPAVVRVISRHGNREKHGSGTHVGQGRIVTCAHILAAGWSVEVVAPTGDRRKATIVATDALHDFALLAIDANARLAHMPLASHFARQGERAVMAGYGGDQGYLATLGVVRGYRGELLAVAGRVRHGDSGGPIYTVVNNENASNAQQATLVGIISEVEIDGNRATTFGPQVGWIRRWLSALQTDEKPDERRATASAPSENTLVELRETVDTLSQHIDAIKQQSPFDARQLQTIVARLDALENQVERPITVQTIRDGQIIEEEKIRLGGTLPLRLVPVPRRVSP